MKMILLKKKSYISFLALCLCICTNNTSFAQDADLKVMKADTIKVTASRIEKELLDVPMSVTALSAEDIKNSTARNVGELLEDVPGVTIQNSGAQGLKRVSIRGEGPSRVLILIDGQKVSENKSMDGVPLLIAPSRIERIEVIRGPASVLYGSEAIGGVINIITKKGGAKAVSADIGVGYDGASNGYNTNASIYGKIDKWNYRASGSWSDQGDLRSATGILPNTSFDQLDANAFLSYDLTDKSTIGAGYDYYDANINSGSMEEGYENFYVKIPSWERQKAYIFSETKNINSFFARLRVDAFWQENTKNMINNVDIAGGMPLIVKNTADNVNEQIGVSAQADWTLGLNTYLITGYELNYDNLDALTVSSTVARNSAMAGMFNKTKTSFHEGQMITNALYAHAETEIPLNFTLDYGARYTFVYSDLYRADGTERKDAGAGTIKPINAGTVADSFDSRPVFNAGVMWDGVKNLALRATFAQGFRVPTFIERFVPSSMGGGVIIANPDLKPENSNSYEIGARYINANLTADLAYFISLADDYIGRKIIDASTDTSMPVNIASAQTHGVEFSISYALPFGLSPYGSGRWQERNYDTGTSSSWNTGLANFTARAGLRYDKSWENVDLALDLYGRFSSNTVDDTGAELVKYDAWETANISAGVYFGKERQYGVIAEVLNIFNTDYAFNSSISEPGVHANVKLVASF